RSTIGGRLPIAHLTTHDWEECNGELETGSELLSLAPHGYEGAGRDGRLRGGVRSRAQGPGWACGGRRRPEFQDLFEHPQHGRDAERGRRVASFRLERVLVVPVPERAASPCRAALSGGARTALLAHPHHRHQARSEEPEDHQGDRARRGGGARRLLAPAYD